MKFQSYVPVDRDSARLLFQVVSDCYETRNIVLTTNLEFSRWVTIFYDDQMTTAMIDRLVHHSQLLVFDSRELAHAQFAHPAITFYPLGAWGISYAILRNSRL